MRWYQSIRTKAIFMVAVPVVGLFLLFIWNTQNLLDRFMHESTVSTVEKFAQTLNLALTPYTATHESMAEIQPFLDELIGSEWGGITYLALLDEQGATIARSRQVPDPLPPADEMDQDFTTRDTLHISRPILLGLSGVGELRYGISIQAIREAGERLFRENLQASAATAGLLLALILGLAGLILVRMNFRISHLLNSSRRIAEGQYELTIADSGHDEISQLASQMNVMAVSIRLRIRELEENAREIRALNEDLELRSEELTATLENLKNTQDSLIQAEKLAGLGSVVAAVAHELNTPVGNALTVSSRLSDKTAQFHEAVRSGLRKSVLEAYLEDTRTATDIMQRSLQRAAELIAGFKHVAVDQTSSQRRRFRLAEVVHDLLITLAPGIRNRNIDIETAIADDIELDSYPGPLGQVITNLFTNAVAHGFDGRDHGSISISGQLLPPDQVEIRFRDDGCGISGEHLARLFDPFFTTKLGKGGSGLGMHIVYNIVTGTLQGSIRVESAIDRGTEFVIRMPLEAPKNKNRPATGDEAGIRECEP